MANGPIRTEPDQMTRTQAGPLISILFRGHLLRRFENPGFAMLIKANHNRASSDHYIVGARFLGFDLSH